MSFNENGESELYDGNYLRMPIHRATNLNETNIHEYATSKLASATPDRLTLGFKEGQLDVSRVENVGKPIPKDKETKDSTKENKEKPTKKTDDELFDDMADDIF